MRAVRDRTDRKIEKLNRGNLPKRRGTKTNLTDHYIRRKDVELSARRMKRIYEKHRKRERQTSLESKDSRYTLIKTDK
jgi:hypothetical protein